MGLSPNIASPFTIWSLIYTFVLTFMIGSLVSADVRTRTEAIGNLFWISCLFNIAWILTWHFGLIWASMIMILGLLTSLVMILWRISGISLFTAGFSLYAGWITVATMANLMVMLVSFGADGFNKTAQNIALTMLLMATLIFVMVLLLRDDWVYGAAGVIALTGIAFRQLSSAEGMLAGKYPLLATVSTGGTIVILILTVFILLKTKGDMIKTT